MSESFNFTEVVWKATSNISFLSLPKEGNCSMALARLHLSEKFEISFFSPRTGCWDGK